MKKFSFLFFVMLALVMPNVVQAQDVVITEIMYNPPESGVDSLEFIEVFNPTALPINMDGYYFSNGVTYTFGNVTINSGDYFVVAIDSVAIGIVYGTNADAEFSGGLSNGGESIALKNSLGVTVDSVNFDDSGVWPSGSAAGQPDGGGASLRLCDPLLDNNDGANWSAATEVTGVIINGFEVLGTPGAASVGCPCVNTTSMITESACITYTVPSGDETYTMSGMYMDTIPNAAGCDSIMTINLTINTPTSSTDVITACDTYTWIDGMTYTTSNNTATFTDVNAAGCDSVITLDLTISTLTTSTTPITACESYTVPSGDETYTMSGMYMDTIPNAAGCDSIMTINLVINTSTSSTDVITSCDTYTWIDGLIYTASNNTATFTDMNTAGCDSIITLDLTINTITTSTTPITACDSYTVPSGDETYTMSGMYMDTIPNAAGCDSIMTINLIINTSTSSTTPVTACESYTVPSGDETYTMSGMYMDTIPNAAGCDSIMTINLTINSSSATTDVQAPGCGPFTWIDGITYEFSNNTATFTDMNAAGCDSIITLDLTLNTSQSTDVITACNTYTWIDGVIYTASNNTATFTETNTAGCDSVITLDLTVNTFTLSTTPITACDTYTVPSGDETYTMSGMYMDTIPNAAGCDSIMTINLTINSSTSSTDVITACDTYTWLDGMTYTASNNTATFTDMNAAGCDSIITLDLTINSSSSSTDVITACDTYTWLDGNPYTASNSSATFTYMNAVGCDSIVTLDLTINNSNTGTDVQLACAPFLWIDGVTYTTANNTATFTETNAAGCDSVVTLNLTFGTPNTGVDVQNECAPFVWADGNTYMTDNSSATYTTTNASGCDSVVTLNLTVILDTPPVADSTSLMDVTDQCSVASITAPTATDECSGALTGVPDVTFPITAQGTTVVTWTFDDGTGNAITQTQNVIITDVTPPTASNPNGVTVQCSGDVPVPNIAFVTDEADNCSVPVVAFVSDVSDGQTCPETITRTFSVTDAVGLSINVTQTIIVNDIVAPLADDNVLATLSDLCSVTPQAPTATDNCVGSVVGTPDVTFPITALGMTTVTWTYTDDCGNQSTQTQDVNIIGIDVTTSVASDLLTLVANNYTPGSGITYQWIDCTADSVLTGQTNHNFTPTYSSDFAVIITENGCTDTSACITVEGASLEDLVLESIELYPNPNRGTFTIKMTDFQGETPFKIVDLLGKEVLNSVLISETTIVELDVEPGVYYVVLEEGTQRVVVQ
jgi:hypothetical protein